LSNLNKRYEQWIEGYKGRLLIVDKDNMDFELEPKDFQHITDRIDAELFGLFPFGEE
jgi:deoxyadenosine/deoxycytidine kinase